MQLSDIKEIVTILKDATLALSKKKKDKIELKEVPKWCSKGDTIEFKVLINTILADYNIRSFLLINKEDNKW